MVIGDRSRGSPRERWDRSRFHGLIGVPRSYGAHLSDEAKVCESSRKPRLSIENPLTRRRIINGRPNYEITLSCRMIPMAATSRGFSHRALQSTSVETSNRIDTCIGTRAALCSVSGTLQLFCRKLLLSGERKINRKGAAIVPWNLGIKFVTNDEPSE